MSILFDKHNKSEISNIVADYALAFSMRSESYTASSALRTWYQVYTVYQNRHAFAIQRHLARVQYDALLKWRIQLREKLKLMKQARIVEKFFLERKFLKVWKAKLEEHQRLKKLKELEICRVRVLMKGKNDEFMVYPLVSNGLKPGTENIKNNGPFAWESNKYLNRCLWQV